jgi:phosphatidylserine/phosphatidylglycerophosphate/cardiolipin synthase-like enzyme
VALRRSLVDSSWTGTGSLIASPARPLLSRALVLLVSTLAVSLVLPQVPATAAVAADDDRKATYSPPLGAVFSSPLDRDGGREILSQVYRSIYASPKGSTIRLVVWNFADPAITTALIAADKRGVNVQVVTAESTKNKQWFRIRDALSTNPDDRSFAVRCHNACRTDRFVMHAKIFLFSRAGKRRNVSMFGSTNLTKAAGNRQWNDQTTTANKGLYDFFVKTFKEYAADRSVSAGNDIFDNGRYQVVLFPVPETNPVAEALEKVKCHPPKGSGAGKRRTVVRIAIAGWFDEFGLNIARQVRRLWDNGCDLRIVTTLAGRKINRVLKQRYGRGRVPIRQVTVDKDKDRVPEYYMHMKSIAVDGYYDGDPRAHMLFTGSPNWSGEARSSDEVWVTVRDAKQLVKDYIRFTDQMFGGPFAHGRIQMMKRPSTLGRQSAYELS